MRGMYTPLACLFGFPFAKQKCDINALMFVTLFESNNICRMKKVGIENHTSVLAVCKSAILITKHLNESCGVA